MKKLVITLLLCVAALPSVFGQKTETAKTPSLVFSGETYYLAYSVQGDGMWLNEYLKPGDTLEKWTDMLALRDYGQSELTPKQAAASVARNLAATNPQARYAIIENEKTGEVIIDFFTWAGSTMEFNVFKFSKVNGVLKSYQFAHREYDDMEKMKAFLSDKQSWVNKMASAAIPKTQKVIKK